jgi:hypothetical protein
MLHPPSASRLGLGTRPDAINNGRFDPLVFRCHAKYPTVLGNLRQRMDVHARSLEMESLLDELETAESRSQTPADMSGSTNIACSTGRGPRTKVFSRLLTQGTVLDDIMSAMLDWIEAVWQFCVERVENFEQDDDWRVGHQLLTYIVTVAIAVQKRSSLVH